MNRALTYLRPFLYIAAIFIWFFAYLLLHRAYSSPTLEYLRLTQLYGFIAAGFLYLSLVVTPLYAIFPTLPLKAYAFKSKKAFGINAFFFAVVHGILALYQLIGGFSKLSFLPTGFLIALSLSSIALLILIILAATSFRFTKKILGTKWKPLHRTVYVAAVLILIHALMIGTHFTDLGRIIPTVSIFASLFLIFIQTVRFDRYLQAKSPNGKRFTAAFVLIITVVSIVTFSLFVPTEFLARINIHGKHVSTR